MSVSMRSTCSANLASNVARVIFGKKTCRQVAQVQAAGAVECGAVSMWHHPIVKGRWYTYAQP